MTVNITHSINKMILHHPKLFFQCIFFFLCFSFFITAHDASHDAYDLLEKNYNISLLYAPWRENYTYNKDKNDLKNNPNECPFCAQMQEGNDARHFILRRFTHNLIALNVFPYTKGHLLIIPLEHKAQLHELSFHARAEMMEIASIAMKILENVYHMKGANIGFNIGNIAGASVVDHIHMHLIPRGPITGFIQLIGKTDVVTFDFNTVYAELKPFFQVAQIQKYD